MGLVCDPIGGLVESPCQGRNGIGVAGALVAAETALAGIPSPAPLDIPHRRRGEKCVNQLLVG